MLKPKKNVAAASLLCLSLVVSACSNNGDGNQANPSNDKAANSQTTGDEANTSAGNATSEADPQFGKYEPGIELTTVRVIDELKFASGETIDSNQWTRTLEERLGIKVKNNWVVKKDQGQEKMNVTLASGDLPDIFGVNATQLKQLAEAGEIYDLTELYEKYASPLVKEFAEATTNGLAASTFDGKLMAFPAGNATIDNAPILWIRKDWLTKLSLPEPKTMDDVIRIADAFTNQDPDGNGKKDSYGLALNKTLFWTNGGGSFGILEGFMNGYHAYPQSWIKDPGGNLVYGSIQPEMKTALAKLQEMYKNGLIDKEFGVKDEVKEAELASAGRLGMGYGQMWNTLFPLTDSRKNDPAADWQAYPIVSVDSTSASPQTPASSISNYYVVRKDAEHPEALFKMLNLFGELQFDPKTPKEVWQQHSKVDGIEVWQYFPFAVGRPDKNLTIHHNVVAALENKDASALNPEELDAYNNSLAMQEGTGDATNWSYDKVFGKAGSFSVIDKYVTEKLIKSSEYYAAPTATMTDKNATLLKMELETFTKIIMGASVDEFDKFVSDWKKLGGDQITDEVNSWNATK
ncbi:putative aldouronate transport system substrate-binding protein [Paenibacillus phyllosphaerae]|uniref:Putative aldouronate transport system substrate-binding protein n=1 Tax=Paenibacillus phyllosphaerae TaxID=274593 RepID=A0A7W5B5U1_9BACL|nr:extracellular solute-binding protein [Paenibacillus phyllosphaerae]MBB3114496.1 putative aldouronate transport system substrate-binding protein [Paenibacillus phyllosphaerae]